jgi:ribosomal protein S18 acetylase RimI-like enzyme
MIKIIKAEELHIPAICELWWEFMEYTQDIEPVLAPRKGTIPVFEKEYLRPAMMSENSAVMVATDGTKVVGYSYAIIEETTELVTRKPFGYIHDMFITRNYRRQGIGGKMYGEIVKWFHEKYIGRIELGILPSNKAACSFWKKHGFTDYRRTLYKKI